MAWSNVILLCKFYITNLFCFYDVCNSTYFLGIFMSISTFLGCTCKWIYGNKYMRSEAET